MIEATKRAIDPIPAAPPAAGTAPAPAAKRARIDDGAFGRRQGAVDLCLISSPTPRAMPYKGAGGAYTRQPYDGAGAHPSTAAAAAGEASVAGMKPAATVLTFAVDSDGSTLLRLLSTQTLSDLVSSLCRYTPVGRGDDEGPNSHAWCIWYRGRATRRSMTRLEDMQLEKGQTLTLTYDYGSPRSYAITLVNSEEMYAGDSALSFPRNRPEPAFPPYYRKYEPSAGSSHANLLDVSFSYLNDWIFHGRQDVSLHLFQAGRKKNYGFMDDGFTTMYLPARPDGLADWLECFNRGASIKPAGVETDGYAHYTWQSVVALPRAKLTQHLTGKYKSSERRGFRDAPIVEGHASYSVGPTVDLDGTFPKVAALAGLRKDRRVTKGWISFARRGDQWSLAICRGSTRETGKCKATPKGLAFEGEGQHRPEGGPLLQIMGGMEIRGLHDLFCVVEGLLRTL